ncbi:hypothetical protein D9615_001818 [Tricholomella constricta]|uniref:Uncharacterized protein n=1 Tax=Tricholomella constricta TaxID=117010 RepID=A0A8H5HNP7_9AGAR|nr:hypothetical protein D9615_001818 [Tricholomella constricta]
MANTHVPSKKRFSRRKSLQLPPQPLDIPIPPSLLQSPYLNSPESIFQRTLSAPHKPSEEDEQWLQDTVPLSLDSRDEQRKRARLSTSSDMSSQGPSSAEESSEDSAHSSTFRPNSTGPSQAPPSPPLVRWRRPNHLVPPSWSGQPRVRSAPCVDDREYFARS